jgi:hypothetical protein
MYLFNSYKLFNLQRPIASKLTFNYIKSLLLTDLVIQTSKNLIIFIFYIWDWLTFLGLIILIIICILILTDSSLLNSISIMFLCFHQ